MKSASAWKGSAIGLPKLRRKACRKARPPRELKHPRALRHDRRGIVVRKVGAARAGSAVVRRRVGAVARAPMVQRERVIVVRKGAVVRGANVAPLVRRKGAVVVLDQMVLQVIEAPKVGVAVVVPKGIVARRGVGVPMVRQVNARAVPMVRPVRMVRAMKIVRVAVPKVRPISSDLVAGPCHLRRAWKCCLNGLIGTATAS